MLRGGPTRRCARPHAGLGAERARGTCRCSASCARAQCRFRRRRSPRMAAQGRARRPQQPAAGRGRQSRTGPAPDVGEARPARYRGRRRAQCRHDLYRADAGARAGAEGGRVVLSISRLTRPICPCCRPIRMRRALPISYVVRPRSAISSPATSFRGVHLDRDRQGGGRARSDPVVAAARHRRSRRWRAPTISRDRCRRGDRTASSRLGPASRLVPCWSRRIWRSGNASGARST